MRLPATFWMCVRGFGQVTRGNADGRMDRVETLFEERFVIQMTRQEGG
jgi:hypothetical protein